MYKKEIVVCSEIHKQDTTQCEHHVGFWDVKTGGM